MFRFKSGDGIASAEALVRETLSRHGLSPGSTTPPAFNFAAMHMPQPGPAIPDGARFDAGRFATQAGARDYRLYTPSTASQGINGIVVMLHGCTQTAEDFAIGTGMNALAEIHRLIVIYPQQSRGDNAQSCWNWFSRGDQQRDLGEPAILAGLTREIAAKHDVPPTRIFAAGLSAGAAMAVILGQTYPDLFAAIGVHSGLAYGAAKDVPSAFAAMAGNPLTAQPAPRNSAPAPRCIIFHGSADQTVKPSNSDLIAQQMLARGPAQTVISSDSDAVNGRNCLRTREIGPDGQAVLERWVIEGLAHAWSGGQRGGSYTDPAGPDASREMLRFFLE